MKVVVDHIGGSRRGQRQEFDLGERLRFGRHPDNEVSFDAHRDLDASACADMNSIPAVPAEQTLLVHWLRERDDLQVSAAKETEGGRRFPLVLIAVLVVVALVAAVVLVVRAQ